MLNLATSSRESSRLLLGALALALMLLVACMFALAAGLLGTHREQGTLRTSSEEIGRLRSAAPPAKTALAKHRNAHRRISVARRIPVTRAVGVESGGTTPQPVDQASGQLTAIVAPAAPASLPQPPPGTEPTVAPDPTPEPPSSPAPEPPPQNPPAKSPAPSQPSGEVLFKATFDVSFKGWYVQSLPGRASLLSTEPFEGSRAARFEVRPGDVEPDTGSQRSEVSGPTFKEGEDLYIRDAIRIPSGNTFEGPWEIVQQLHEEEWNGSPGMAVFLDPGPALRIGAGDGSPTYWTSSTLETDRWYELIYRVELSQDSSVGFVEVWLDGNQQSLANGQTRMYGQTMQTAGTYLKAGIYRSKSSTGTSIVEHDSIVVGTSLAAVMGA
jgi:Polysaccharide lyase